MKALLAIMSMGFFLLSTAVWADAGALKIKNDSSKTIEVKVYANGDRVNSPENPKTLPPNGGTGPNDFPKDAFHDGQTISIELKVGERIAPIKDIISPYSQYGNYNIECIDNPEGTVDCNLH